MGYIADGSLSSYVPWDFNKLLHNVFYIIAIQSESISLRFQDVSFQIVSLKFIINHTTVIIIYLLYMHTVARHYFIPN